MFDDLIELNPVELLIRKGRVDIGRGADVDANRFAETYRGRIDIEAGCVMPEKRCL